jgi:hypothetical protein
MATMFLANAAGTILLIAAWKRSRHMVEARN